MVGNWKDSKETDQKIVKVKTFGDFEIFLNDKPVEFEKTLEK